VFEIGAQYVSELRGKIWIIKRIKEVIGVYLNIVGIIVSQGMNWDIIGRFWLDANECQG
jgi:hypothetical protein